MRVHACVCRGSAQQREEEWLGKWEGLWEAATLSPPGPQGRTCGHLQGLCLAGPQCPVSSVGDTVRSWAPEGSPQDRSSRAKHRMINAHSLRRRAKE